MTRMTKVHTGAWAERRLGREEVSKCAICDQLLTVLPNSIRVTKPLLLMPCNPPTSAPIWCIKSAWSGAPQNLRDKPRIVWQFRFVGATSLEACPDRP